MSSRGTSTSSFTHRYCCLSLEPQVLWSRLNEIARLASVAEYSFTGLDTSPNETVNDAMDRAAMVVLPLRDGHYRTAQSPERFRGRFRRCPTCQVLYLCRRPAERALDALLAG